MRSSTITRLKRLTIIGALLAPSFWTIKWILEIVHVVRDSPVPPITLADRVFDAANWNVVGVGLLFASVFSLLLLWIIVCPPDAT
jgi:hypothetical protein